VLVIYSLGKKPPQNVSFKQGLAAPLLCSVSLFGFYAVLRFFPNLDIRTFISAYLGLAGVVAVASNLAPPLRAILPNDDSTSWRIGMYLLILTSLVFLSRSLGDFLLSNSVYFIINTWNVLR